MIPNELIIKIYNYTISKLQMIEVFPWLKNIIPKCDNCGKESYFNVTFQYNDSCDNCTNHIHTSKNTYLCNLNCKNLYYDIEYGGYIIEPSKNNNYKLKAELLCEKDDCFYCGKRIMYNVITTGYKIRKLPEKPKTKIQENIELFIKNKLILDEKFSIEMSKMIFLYKQFFNITKKLSKKQNKEFNKQIHKELMKLFQYNKNYYIGC